MDERTFEIVLSRYPEDLLPDGWRLEGQQVGVVGGTLDLLYRDPQGMRHVVELKKGPATLAAADQVLAYARALEAAGGGRCEPWVVAHVVPDGVARAAARLGVQTLVIPPDRCERVLARHAQFLRGASAPEQSAHLAGEQGDVARPGSGGGHQVRLVPGAGRG